MFTLAAAIAILRRAANGPVSVFLGRSIYAASQFAILAAVGRCCGTGAVGDVVLGLAIAVPLFALCGGQLRLVQATDADERFSFATVERLGLLGHGLGMLALGAIALAFRPDPIESATASGGFATLLGVGLARAGESWSEIAYGALQRRRAFAAIGLSTALKCLLGTAVALVVLLQTDSPGAAFAATGIAWLVGAVCIDRRLAKQGLAESSRERGSSAELLGRALPLSAGATVSTFDTQAPRYFVEAFLGSRALGLFGVTHYAALAILTLIIPLTYAWTPAMADDVAGGNSRAFRSRSLRALAFAGILGAGASLAALPAGAFLATIFREPSLAEGWTLTLAVSAAGVLAPAAVLEAMLRAAHGFRLLCALQIASLIVHVGACATGLGWFGLEGVAGGMLVRSLVYLAMLAVGSWFAAKAAFAKIDSSAIRPEEAEYAGRFASERIAA